MGSSGDSQGRAILQVAVNAIHDGNWEELTLLLQNHAPALQAARMRLEEHAFEKHAIRADATPADWPSPRKPAAAAAASAQHSQGAGETAKAVWQAFLAMASWADAAPWTALMVSQVFVLAAYAPAFTYSGFIMDDTVAVEKNANVVSPQFSLAQLLGCDYWGLPMHGSGWTNKSFRPLTTLTFRWNYLLHGLDSSGFHATNVLFHSLTSLLVGRLANTTVGLPSLWAVIAALFFGLHPVHTENVLYLVGRADVLAAMLAFMAMNAYVAWFRRVPLLQRLLSDAWRMPEKRSGYWRVLGLVFPVLLITASGLCKETGFMFFFLLIGIEFLDLLHAWDKAASVCESVHEAVWRRARVRLPLLVASTVLSFMLRYRHTGGTELNMSPQDNPISFESSRWVRMLSYSFLHGVYTRLLWWPQFLCYDYSMDAIPMLRSATDCRLMLPLAAYVGAAAALTSALRASAHIRRASLVSLAMLVVPFVPASNVFFPVGTVIGERLLYIPSAGFCLAIVVCLHAGHTALSPTLPKKRSCQGSPRSLSPQPFALRRQAIGGGLILTMLAVLGVRTFIRVRTWSSGETLFIVDGMRQPTSSKTQFNLGITYMQRQEWDLAVEALVRCAWADPLSSLPFYRIGQIEILRGNFASAERWLSAALDKFGASLMVRDEEVFHDLALAMFQIGKRDAAERRLQIALQLNPDFAKGWNNFGCCMASQSIENALRAVRKAVQLAPENPQYWANLAVLAGHTGDQATAMEAWRQASMLYPGMPEPRDCAWEFAFAG